MDNKTFSTTDAIEVKNLECGYEGRVVLRDVTFSVKRAEIFFIIGGSGCGKSTLLRHLVGLNRPTAGEVRFFGRSFMGADLESRRNLLKTFGVLYQSGALWSSLTLRENVALPLEEYTPLSKGDIHDLVTLKLAQVGLTGFDHYFPAEISGGMKKRAGLARALALDPSIVFFDEPSAGLDPITSREIDELVVQVRDALGTTCVVVSHELDSIFRIGDRLIMLDKAQQGVIAEGKPADLRDLSVDSRVSSFLRTDRERRAAPH
ncbi:MAG: ATP-binding cassette domain-containing protein [Opitutaceae bacterium]|nr:ATP-binding cassette domain-containing protein [Opitutaceae bacterium]